MEIVAHLAQRHTDLNRRVQAQLRVIHIRKRHRISTEHRIARNDKFPRRRIQKHIFTPGPRTAGPLILGEILHHGSVRVIGGELDPCFPLPIHPRGRRKLNAVELMPVIIYLKIIELEFGDPFPCGGRTRVQVEADILFCPHRQLNKFVVLLRFQLSRRHNIHVLAGGSAYRRIDKPQSGGRIRGHGEFII